MLRLEQGIILCEIKFSFVHVKDLVCTSPSHLGPVVGKPGRPLEADRSSPDKHASATPVLGLRACVRRDDES